jgi:adenylate cyclase
MAWRPALRARQLALFAQHFRLLRGIVAMEENRNEAMWKMLMQDGFTPLRRAMTVFRNLPSDPRCAICYSPFEGVGGFLLRRFTRRKRSNYNPRFCTECETIVQNYPGGAEIEMTLLFADVRGSTKIAEGMTPNEFGRLMDRFYSTATSAVMKTHGLIEKFVGDNVTVIFAPGIAGQDHARMAINCAVDLLEATGHRSPDGPWLPVGAGIHTGVAFIGSVGSAGVSQLTALGETPNTAARLSSNASAGEILISGDASRSAEFSNDDLEHRRLELKGRAEPVDVSVVKVGPPHAANLA